MPADVGERLDRNAVRLADAAQVVAQPRPLVLPAADADVHVLGLREDPAVAAGDVGELDDGTVCVRARGTASNERCLLRRRRGRSHRRGRGRGRGAVGTVGRHHEVGVHGGSVDARRAVERHAGAVANLDAGCARGVEEEGVQPPPLRHQDHRPARAPLDRGAVAEAQLDHVDLVLDDGVTSTGHCRTARVVRPPPHGLSRGKVARSASRTEAPDRASRYAVAEPGVRRRRRGRRSAPRAEATMPALRGGVPERPKGTGCKPVGSAYGGSNPPAPIIITHRRLTSPAA